jgi:spermidine synthase
MFQLQALRMRSLMPNKVNPIHNRSVIRNYNAVLLASYSMSGFSALIYQVSWQRILAIHSGVGIYSVALIVSAFMAGLGIGSLVGSTTVNKRTASTALAMFVVCELLIGIWGLISCRIYYDWIGSQANLLFGSLWISGIVHFSALLIPTMLMGMSLPFLSQFVAIASPNAAKHIGLLYASNIFGAALGALITPWILIRFLGIENAVQIAAVSNLLVGLISLSLWRSLGNPTVKVSSNENGNRSREKRGKLSHSGEAPFYMWFVLYGVSGVFSLALEVLWFRIVEVSVRATAFTFGSVLAIYLAGLGSGCLIGGWTTRWVRYPLRAFLFCQSSLLVYSGISTWMIIRLPTSTPVYSAYFSYWTSPVVYGLSDEWDYYRILLLYLLLPIFLFGIPTVLMGISFSLLQQGVQDEPSLVGKKVGILQSSNILGNVLGSLIAGLVLIHWFGTPRALQTVMFLGIFFPVVGATVCSDKRQWFFAALLLLIGLFWPSSSEFWGRLHGVSTGQGRYAEDASGLMAITPDDSQEHDYRVSMNGKLQSWIPFGGAHTELGVLAAILHPEPIDAAIIGLGSGDTAWAAACRSELQEIHVFEICAAEKVLLRQIANDFPEMHRLMTDGRVSIIDDDGRKALAMSTRKYDMIEADALPPQCAYAGNIYSIEFFRLCASKLKPRGLMCQWAPTVRTMRTFASAFPYVVIAPTNSILIGSNEPIELDLETLRARLSSPQTSSHLGTRILSEMESRLLELRTLVLPDEEFSSVNSDLFPMDEFRAP